MTTLITILLVLLGIIVMLLILALFMRRKHFVKREIIINAPLQKVFTFLKFLKNQDQYNIHAKVDSERKEEFKGTDGTVGFTISWNGNKKVGEGQKEITNIIEGKRIETEIRFVRPMTTNAIILMETEFISDNQTKVTWSNSGTLKYPVNIMITLFEKMLPKDIDSSLSTLKILLEK